MLGPSPTPLSSFALFAAASLASSPPFALPRASRSFPGLLISLLRLPPSVSCVMVHRVCFALRVSPLLALALARPASLSPVAVLPFAPAARPIALSRTLLPRSRLLPLSSPSFPFLSLLPLSHASLFAPLLARLRTPLSCRAPPRLPCPALSYRPPVALPPPPRRARASSPASAAAFLLSRSAPRPSFLLSLFSLFARLLQCPLSLPCLPPRPRLPGPGLHPRAAPCTFVVRFWRFFALSSCSPTPAPVVPAICAPGAPLPPFVPFSSPPPALVRP